MDFDELEEKLRKHSDSRAVWADAYDKWIAGDTLEQSWTSVLTDAPEKVIVEHSSNVASFEYFPQRSDSLPEGLDYPVLVIGFLSGARYAYEGVTRDVWDDRAIHPSMGQWVAREIKPNYKATKLDAL
jgi:hypothetical protein